ncbi:MAG: helix-turn-helix domain-containing protein [Victivallaceae bacterium]
MNKNYPEILERLFCYIKQNNFTQKEVAIMLGVSKNTITNWKKTGDVSPDKAKEIAKLTFDFAANIKSKNELLPTEHDDRFFNMIKDDWKYLDEAERGQVAGLAAKLALPKKDCGNSESDCSEVANI